MPFAKRVSEQNISSPKLALAEGQLWVWMEQYFTSWGKKKSGYWSRCFYGNWYNFILVMDDTGKLQGGLRWWSFIWQSLADFFSGVIRQFWLCSIFYITIYNRICFLFYITILYTGVVWEGWAWSLGKATGVAVLLQQGGPLGFGQPQGGGGGCQQWNSPINCIFAHFWTWSRAALNHQVTKFEIFVFKRCFCCRYKTQVQVQQAEES